MENAQTENSAARGGSDLLDAPLAFIDDHGGVVIVGFDAWNKASFVDADRAFPDSWTRLIPKTANVELSGAADSSPRPTRTQG